MKIAFFFYKFHSTLHCPSHRQRYTMGCTCQQDLVQFSDSGVSPFNRLQFHYLGEVYANEVSKCQLLKFYTKLCNEVYNMTNYWKIITSARGGGVTFCAQFRYLCDIDASLHFFQCCTPSKNTMAQNRSITNYFTQ